MRHALSFSAALLAVLAVLAAATTAAANPSILPLKITIATPTELLAPTGSGAATPVSLTERQAITAVFSRPVIALGSDFGSPEGFGGVAPFTVSCNGQKQVPATQRWVTTNIARFDPAVPWPSDLSCTLQWNASLTSWDGAQLQLGSAPARVALSTPGLTLSLSAVTSELANNLTDNAWSAYEGRRCGGGGRGSTIDRWLGWRRVDGHMQRDGWLLLAGSSCTDAGNNACAV